MIRFFAAHPTVGNILMMAIIAVGLVSLGSLNKESFPLLDASKVQVVVAYPGASPANVEDGICNPLEDATDGISFLEDRECDARDNRAIFTLEMAEGGTFRQFTDDVKTAVDGIQSFPDDAEDPVITQLGRVNHVANVAISSKHLTAAELKTLGEHYRDRLVAISEIPVVTLDGFSDHQLQVRIRTDTQKKYNLSVQDIANLIAAQAVELPAGTLEATETSYQIEFDNVRKTADELGELVIINTQDGGEIKLSDIAHVEDRFERREDRIELDGERVALLKVSKNTTDDTLKVADALNEFIERENGVLPEGTRLHLLSDSSASVRDRLKLLVTNGWQGLLLASGALLLFFSWRYTLWIAAGLPVSFLGGLALMVVFGVSINMISMVALLMAIGILMDDAIVLSESIDQEHRKGKPPIAAAVDGTRKVLRGVFASFLTSAFLFGSLLMMKGDMGQILGVLPVVLLSVLTVSLIEAFLILPHHLLHSLEVARRAEAPRWRSWFGAVFDRLRDAVALAATRAMELRYLTVGVALAMLVSSVGLIATGAVKFKAFPDLEGNNLEARVLLPQGTPLAETERTVQELVDALEVTNAQLSANETEPLVKHVQVTYGEHGDAPEEGTHLATISVDLLNTELRTTRLHTLVEQWRNNTSVLPQVLSVQYKEPKVGPAGRAIHVRLTGQDLDELSRASWDVQNWLRGYDGVHNLLDDLRPGKPQYRIRMKPGALAAGIDSRSIAAQLRTAYLEVKISEVYHGREPYEIVAKLDVDTRHGLSDFDDFTVFSRSGQRVPLSSVATVTEQRDFARIGRVDHQRTVNVYGDVDPEAANTSEVIEGLQANHLSELQQRYPRVKFEFKGEIENGTETRISILTGFGLGSFGVFLLLSLQFRNYREPLLVMLNIPLALIGAIWGHLIMGLDFTLPSMIGFVSLAGVVVNDSILMVEFVKNHIEEGMPLRAATSEAVRGRFRAIFLTSVTTIAGMTPLLFETSSQALILVPLVTSVVFGMLTSTVLIMIVLPAVYGITEDIGFVTLQPPHGPAMEDALV